MGQFNNLERSDTVSFQDLQSNFEVRTQKELGEFIDAGNQHLLKTQAAFHDVYINRQIRILSQLSKRSPDYEVAMKAFEIAVDAEDARVTERALPFICNDANCEQVQSNPRIMAFIEDSLRQGNLKVRDQALESLRALAKTDFEFSDPLLKLVKENADQGNEYAEEVIQELKINQSW